MKRPPFSCKDRYSQSLLSTILAYPAPCRFPLDQKTPQSNSVSAETIKPEGDRAAVLKSPILRSRSNSLLTGSTGDNALSCLPKGLMQDISSRNILACENKSNCSVFVLKASLCPWRASNLTVVKYY